MHDCDTSCGTSRRHVTIDDARRTYSACIHTPTSLTASSPTVIFLHSLHGCKLGPNNLYPFLADTLAERGIRSVRFDFAGNGESPGRMEVDLTAKARDASAVIEYCVNDLGAQSICLLCISDISSAVFYLGKAIEHVSGAIFLSPKFTHAEQAGRQGGRLGLRFLEYIRKLGHPATYGKLLTGRVDVRSVMSVLKESAKPPGASGSVPQVHKCTVVGEQLRRIPALIIAGEKDPYSAKNLRQYLPLFRTHHLPWELRTIEGGGHNFGSDHERKRLVEYLTDYLLQPREQGGGY